MNKPNLDKVINEVKTTAKNKSPQILTAIGISGMIATVVLAVKATPKALQHINEAAETKHNEPLTKIEVIKVAWKSYIPAAVSGAVSIACLIGAQSVNSRRNAALATAYKISETALTEFRNKVVDNIGEKKEKDIRDQIDKDHIERNPVTKSEVIITDKGNTLCYDRHSGRYFKSDIDKIRAAVNELNRRLVYDMYISLNEFYDELNLEHTEMGYELGWKLDDGFVDVSFSSQLSDDGTPCIVMNYTVAPQYGYSELM